MTAKTDRYPLPDLIAGADWSVRPKGRVMAVAMRIGDGYQVGSTEPVGEVGSLIQRLKERAGSESILLGLDFPIGLPLAYADLCGFTSFREALPELGVGRWKNFYVVSAEPSLEQPFFPPPSRKKGEYRRDELARSLGVKSFDSLLRKCDHATRNRPAPECLFWTLGAKQVGKGMIVGWRDMIAPILKEVAIWPFDGSLTDLLTGEKPVLAEVYPAECGRLLGFRMGAGTGYSKRRMEDRARVADHLLSSSAGDVDIAGDARREILEGFASDDAFDAMCSSLGILSIVINSVPFTEPDDTQVRQTEGWILGSQEVVA